MLYERDIGSWPAYVQQRAISKQYGLIKLQAIFVCLQLNDCAS